MHKMKVQTKYFRLLKNGVKTIELRLYDDKRQLIAVGDEIQFSDLANPEDIFVVRVMALYLAENFEKLCDLINPEKAGFESRDQLVQTMQQFYNDDAQQQYGVVGIEVQTV